MVAFETKLILVGVGIIASGMMGYVWVSYYLRQTLIIKERMRPWALGIWRALLSILFLYAVFLIHINLQTPGLRKLFLTENDVFLGIISVVISLGNTVMVDFLTPNRMPGWKRILIMISIAIISLVVGLVIIYWSNNP